MKALLDGLVAVFTANKVHGEDGFYKKADHAMQKIKDQERTVNRSEHPVVRTHPETGRKALYVSMPHTERFKKMSVEESRPLLDYLVSHATKPEFVTRFQWRVGSLALTKDSDAKCTASRSRATRLAKVLLLERRPRFPHRPESTAARHRGSRR
jgi:taurine dioxygenase